MTAQRKYDTREEWEAARKHPGRGDHWPDTEQRGERCVECGGSWPCATVTQPMWPRMSVPEREL